MKKLFVLAMSAMMLFAATASASAANHPSYDSSPATTPVKLNIEKTGIDFTVSENISITAKANTVIPTAIDEYTIKNNNTSSYMKVDSIEVTDGAWTKVAYSDEKTFLDYPINSNHYALKVKSIDTTTENGSHKEVSQQMPDLFGKWSDVGKIWYGETMRIGFNGFVTPVTIDLDDNTGKIAKIVATVSLGE